MRNVGFLLVMGLLSVISMSLFSSCDKKNGGVTMQYIVVVNDSSVDPQDVVSILDKRLRAYGNKNNSIEILEADFNFPERIKITVCNVKNPSMMRKLLITSGYISFHETLGLGYGDYISRLVPYDKDSVLSIFERAYMVDDIYGVVERAMPDSYHNPLISFFRIEDVDSIYNTITEGHAKDILPVGAKLFKGNPVSVDGRLFVPLYVVKGNPVMDGRYIVKVKTVDDYVMGNIIEIHMNNEGRRLFESITAKNIGNPLSIVIDNQLVSSPIINDVIKGGKCQITGGFNSEHAELLSMLLSEGSLPSDLTLISEQTVSTNGYNLSR